MVADNNRESLILNNSIYIELNYSMHKERNVMKNIKGYPCKMSIFKTCLVLLIVDVQFLHNKDPYAFTVSLDFILLTISPIQTVILTSSTVMWLFLGNCLLHLPVLFAPW